MTSDLARPLSAIRGRNGHIKTTRPGDSLAYPRYERLDSSLKSCKWSEMIDQSLWESVSGGYENWNVLNFDILLRDVKKKYTYVDKDSGAAVTLKLPSISFFPLLWDICLEVILLLFIQRSGDVWWVGSEGAADLVSEENNKQVMLATAVWLFMCV